MSVFRLLSYRLMLRREEETPHLPSSPRILEYLLITYIFKAKVFLVLRQFHSGVVLIDVALLACYGLHDTKKSKQ